MASDKKFKTVFFKYYDRKIADGTITFSSLGMSKVDFTRLCTEEDFVPAEEEIGRMALVMRLTEEETAEMIETAKPRR